MACFPSLNIRAWSTFAIVPLLLSACNRLAPDNTAAAYVAPATLNVRPQVTQKDASVAVLHHGERVSIVDVRRRFVKLKTAKGLEGWVDSTQLLTPEKWAQLQRDTQAALQLPSEGAAGVYEPLNIHIEPSRQSAVFAKIPEGGSVAVLAHRLQPKVQGAAKAPVFALPRPEPVRKSNRKAKELKSAFPFPKPTPPKAPADADDSDDEPEPVKAQPATPAKPVVLEDWTLVRTKDRQVGWVLTRNLVMSIPDEVAQYAEGRRITSYFALGTVVDEEKGKKSDWLWTTLSDQATYDFDSWRVFLWNRKHHRYETSYRQRDVEGYFPVHVEAADEGSRERRFSLILKDDNGKLWLRSFRFDGTLVRANGAVPYNPDSKQAAAVPDAKKP